MLGSVYTTVDHGAVQCATSVGFNAYGFFVPSISISADDVACAGEAVDLEANITSYGWDTSVEWIVDEIPADTVWTPMSSTTTSTGTGGGGVASARRMRRGTISLFHCDDDCVTVVIYF